MKTENKKKDETTHRLIFSGLKTRTEQQQNTNKKKRGVRMSSMNDVSESGVLVFQPGGSPVLTPVLHLVPRPAYCSNLEVSNFLVSGPMKDSALSWAEVGYQNKNSGP